MRQALTVVALLLAVLGVYGLMYAGWRARARRESDVPEPPAPPASLLARADEGIEATYVSTTGAGDWLDRITVHGLGVRSDARLLVDAAGVLIARIGAPDLFVPAAALRDVRRETMRAGKALAGGGLVVLEWQLGNRLVATALSPRRAVERDELMSAAAALLSTSGGER